MNKKIASAAILLVLVLSSGCTGNAKTGPEPQDPGPPLMGAGQAVTAAEQYLDNYYNSTVIIVPFTLTHKLQGGPCAWSGSDAGNASRWLMVFEGMVAYAGSGRHLMLAVTVEYRDGRLGARHDTVRADVVQQGDADSVYGEIDNVSLASNISFDNHDIYEKADAAKWVPLSVYYLQSITMTLYDNGSSPYHPGAATWEVSWKYIAKDTLDASTSTVVLDASSGAVLKVVPPG